jgi:transcriptional regulator with XRE-family HTH domain
LGQFLKKLRLEKGLEQRELARKLRVNKNSVCEWENERKKPSRESRERLARFFKISKQNLESFEMKRK